MPKGPKGEKRPTDAIGLAVMIGKIATGQVDDETPDDGKDPAAKAMGSKGGKARAANLTPEQRSEIAKKAAEKRWARTKDPYFRPLIQPNPFQLSRQI